MTDERVKELGKISSVSLGIEDDVGVFTASICFDFGGTSQCMSGWTLDTWDEKRKRRIGTAAGLDYIIRVLEAAGVGKWEDMVGNEVWVEHDWSHVYSLEAPNYREHKGKFDTEEWKKEWFPPKVIEK
jgi:hypothetical protein